MKEKHNNIFVISPMRSSKALIVRILNNYNNVNTDIVNERTPRIDSILI